MEGILMKNSQLDLVWSEVKTFYKLKQFCDLIITCNDDQVISCHRLVLASVSNKFRTLLQISVDQEQSEIILPDYSSNDIQPFIDSLYEGTVSTRTPESVFKLFGVVNVDVTSLVQPKVEIQETEASGSFMMSTELGSDVLKDDPDEVGHASSASNRKRCREGDTSKKTNKPIKIKFTKNTNYVDDPEDPWAMMEPMTKKPKRERKPEPPAKSIPMFGDKDTDNQRMIFFNLMTNARENMRVHFLAEELQVITHTGKKARENSDFQALVGIRGVRYGVFEAKPLAWSFPESPDVALQFEQTTAVYKSVFGFSESDVSYNPMLFSRQGLSKWNRSNRVRYELKRKYANFTDGELVHLAQRPDIVEALARGPVSANLQEIYQDMDCIFQLTSDLAPDQMTGVAHLTWDTMNDPQVSARLIKVSGDSQEESVEPLMRTLFDVWCVGRQQRIPDSPHLREKYKKLMEPMETYAVTQHFQLNDRDRSERLGYLNKERQCPDCGKIFTGFTADDDNKFNHHRAMHYYENFECSCPETFTTFKQKKMHVQLVHSNGKYEKCDKEGCDYVATKNLMDKHKNLDHTDSGKSESGTNVFASHSGVCDLCGKSFSNPGALYKHTLTHKEYKCKICNEVISGYASYCTHRKRFHNPKQTFPCSACGKTFPSKLRVREHFGRIHMVDKDRPKQCPDCDRGFVSKRQLDLHRIQAHFKNRPFKCRWGCGADYNDYSSRSTHEKKKHGKRWEPPPDAEAQEEQV